MLMAQQLAVVSLAAAALAAAATKLARSRGGDAATSCAIGIFAAENSRNISMLLRSAFLLGAETVFTVRKQYKKGRGASWGPGDTLGAAGHLNTVHCADVDELLAALPGATLVGVEKGGTPLRSFTHPRRAIYLLGAENAGLPADVQARCEAVVELETVRGSCGGAEGGAGIFNVHVAGSLILFHRAHQLGLVRPVDAEREGLRPDAA